MYCCAGGALDDEEPAAVDGHVGVLAGRGDLAGAPVLVDAGDRRAQPLLLGVGAAEVGGRGGAGVVGDVELRLEQHSAALEAGGVGVGDVVADDVQRLLVDVQARKAGVQCAGQCHGVPCVGLGSVDGSGGCR